MVEGGGIVIGGMEGEERGGEINIDMVRSFHRTTTLKHTRHLLCHDPDLIS